MKTIVKLTVPEMVGFLKTITTESMFVAMDTVTLLVPGKKLVKDCPFGTVTKTATVQGALNWDYAKKMRKAQAEEAGVPIDQVPEYERKAVWHTPLCREDGKATALRVNKKTPDNGKFYLFYNHIKTTNTVYTDASGKVIEYEALKPYFKEAEEALVPVRCVTLENVRQLRACGLVIKGDLPASGSMTIPVAHFDNAEQAEEAMKDAFQWTGGKPEFAS
jgi:hypothetical protein